MLNKWVGMGRLVHNPELRNTQSGIAVASFTIAIDRDYKGRDGERETDFVDVVAWRQNAVFASKYCEKGRMVAIEGRWQMRDYTDKQGNKRRAWEVLADHIYFADSRRAADPPSDEPVEEPAGFTEINDDDGDLPF